MSTSRFQLIYRSFSTSLLFVVSACGGGEIIDTRPGKICTLQADCPNQRCVDRRCVDHADAGTPDGGSDGGTDGGTTPGNLTISATSGSATAEAGGSPAPLTFSLGNSGGAALHFAVSCTVGVPTPTSGSIAAGQSASISVAFAGSRTAGTQTGNCTATTSDGSGGPRTIAISLVTTPDVTAPAVAITSPAAAGVVFGTTQLTASATDAVGVTSVQFLVDGANVGPAVTAAPYAASFDTSTVANGSHSFAARATDAAGNAATSPAITATVSNGGHVTLAPTTGTSTVEAGKVTPGVSFTLGNDGSASLAFTVGCDSGASATPALGNIAVGGTTPVAIALPKFTTTGSKTVICTATAPGGPRAFTATVTVTPDVTAPAVVVTAPAAGQTVSGAVSLGATATDEVGVTSVEYRVDGALIATATGPSFAATWDSWTVANGSHSVTAKAIDAANNSATSAAVSFTTANGVLGMPTNSVSLSTTTNHATPNTPFSLTNGGAASLAYSIACSSGAGATPTSGTISASGSANISMSIPVYATTGSFTATCTATTSNGLGGPLTFTATVNVAQSTSATTFTRPTAGANKVCSRVLLTATTSDGSVTKIRFDLDGTPIGTATSGPNFQLLWDSASTTNGSHTLTANGLNASSAAVGRADAVTINVGNGDLSSGACTSVHLTLGMPETVSTSSSTNANHYLGLPHQYSHSFNSSTKTSNWTAWELNSLWFGTQTRTDAFRIDDTLPANFQANCTDGTSDTCLQAEAHDYSEPVYDRGHMCPSADRTLNTVDNQNTFYLTNMVPQHPNNNQGVWEKHETATRTMVTSNGKTAFIMSGPLNEWPSQPFPTTHYVSRDGYKNALVVPTATWKVVVVLDSIGMGPQDVTTDSHTRVIAIVVPNCWTSDGNNFPGCPYTTAITKGAADDWPKFCTTVADIEARTGLTFFSEVPSAIRNVLRTSRDASCCIPGTTGATACYQ